MQEGNTNPGIPGHSPGTQQWERHQSDAQGHTGDQEFFPDLSAFLSQDELNKSVDLAREAIGCPSAEDVLGSTSRPNAACQAILGPRESLPRQDLQNMDRVLQQNEAQEPERTLNSCQPVTSDDESPSRAQQRQSGSIDTSCSAYRPSAIRGSEGAGFGQQKQGVGKSVGSETDSKHNAAALIEELSSLFKSGPPRRGGRNRGRRAGRGGHVSTEDICQAMDCPKQGPTAPAPVERIRVQSKEQLFQMRQQQQQAQQQQQQEVLPQQQEDQNSLCDYIQHQQQQQDVHKPTEPTTCQEDFDAKQDSNHNDHQQQHHHHQHQHQEASAQREFPNQQQLENSVETAAAASAQQQQQQAVEPRSGDAATSPLAREPPRFTTKLKSREVPEGSRVQLDCRVSGAPAPSVRWFCEGKELGNSPDIQILQNADLQTLIISEAFQEDTGRYTCLASNVDGTDSTSAEIYIEGATSSDSEGEASGASLEDDLAQAQKLMSVSLTIAASPQNSGTTQVEMQAQPPLAQPITAPVIPQKVASPSFGLPGFDGQSGVMAAPVFTKPLADATASEGQLVVLECRVKGSPAPKITWYREDTAVDDSPDFRLLQKKPRSVAEPEEICTLIISEAFPEDSGTFRCTASSKLGTVSCSAQLIVHGATDGYMSSNTCGPSLVVESTHLSTSESMYMDTLPPPILDSFISDISADKPDSTVQLPAATESLFANGRMPDFIVPGKKSVRAAAATSSFNSSAEAALAELRRSIDDVAAPPPSMTTSVPMPAVAAVAAAAATAGDAVGPEGKTNAKAGLRVHFRLPGEAPPEGFGGELPRPGQGLPSPVKEPPPLPAKPKLDPLQLQQLHNQVLLEQQEAFLLSHHQQLPFPPPPAAFLQSPTTPSQPPVAETAVPPPPPAPPAPPGPPAPPATTTASMSLANSAALPLNQQPSRASVGQQSFSYARPKQFIAAQNLTSTIVSAGSPSSSPVPTSLSLSLPAPPPPPPQTAPPANNAHRVASPTLSSPTFLNNSNAKTAAAYSPPIAMSPPPQFSAASPTAPATYPGSPLAQPGHTWSSLPQSPQSPPTVSPPASFVQSPAAFLSALLPSLPSLPPTNAMGLPRAAPSTQMQGSLKRQSRGPRSVSEDDIRDTKDALIQDLEKKLRFKEDILHNGQSRLTYEEKMARRLLGPNSTAVVFQADEPEERDVEAQEYKVSSFEQRLMSEIEFRLERTPVEESDDEVEHDDIPTGRCIAPIFERKLKHFKTFEGSPITFSCKVSGTPTPKIYWFKDGNQISKKSERFQMQRDSEGNCSLHIPLTTMDDDGNYTVMAGNPQGRISCSGRLMVQNVNQRGRVARSQSGQPAARRPRSQSRESRDDSDMVQEKNFRPHFLQAPGDTMAHEGKLCRLDCKVSGLPTPELAWEVNGRPVRPDATHKMLVRENGVHSLVIEPLTVQDGGLYTCTATNRAGQNSFSLNLTIVAKQLTRAPVIVEKLQNTGVAEGQPVRLECRVHSMPPPTIFWKKENETLIPHRERTSMHQDPSGYVCLIIQPTRKEDAGWYTVSAKNSVGITSCTARLDIYAEWHHEIPKTRRVRPSSSRYAALTDQGLDVRSAFLPDPSHAGAQGNLVESDEL
uniref:Palladin-like isoform X2 n=2 Tax=Petromyzon marinus TaxID=7757 RepID=A0AAJ7WPS6_PETMA|nr:palladin-like isoform X2 [Petromyzon marinus]